MWRMVKLTVELIVSTLMFSGFADGTTNRKVRIYQFLQKITIIVKKGINFMQNKNVTGKIIGKNKFS